jgi:hypothetical protein
VLLSESHAPHRRGDVIGIRLIPHLDGVSLRPPRVEHANPGRRVGPRIPGFHDSGRLAQRLQRRGRQRDRSVDPERVDARAPRRFSELIERSVAVEARRRREGHEADSSAGRLEVPRRARGREDVPAPCMHELRGVEVPTRLAHPLRAPVHRMVVGAREQPEAELGQIPRHGGRRHEAPVVLRSRRGAQGSDVEDRCLEVAERGAGAAQQLHDPRECLVALEERAQRSRADAVADGGQREAVGNARLQLSIRAAARIEEGIRAVAFPAHRCSGVRGGSCGGSRRIEIPRSLRYPRNSRTNAAAAFEGCSIPGPPSTMSRAPARISDRMASRRASKSDGAASLEIVTRRSGPAG